MFEHEQDALIRFFSNVSLHNLQPLNVEFQAIEWGSSDYIFSGVHQGKKIIVHYEFQSDNDSTMDSRMLRYATELYAKYKLPVYQQVIYTGAKIVNMPSAIRFNVLANSKLDYCFELHDLGSTPMETLVHVGPILYPFLPLAARDKRKKDPTAFLRSCVQQISESHLSIPEKRDLIFKQELFAGKAFAKEELDLTYREAEKMIDITQSAGYLRFQEKIEGQSLYRSLMDIINERQEKLDSKSLEKIRTGNPDLLRELITAIATDEAKFYRLLESI